MSMRQVVVLVEGQAEEALVSGLLVPAAQAQGVFLTPTLITTSATAVGARRSRGWERHDTRIHQLLRGSHWHRVGLLLDYDRYPQDAPGWDARGENEHRQRMLTTALRNTYPDPRFYPLVVLHEIEALVLAAIAAGQGEGLLPADGLTALRRAVKEAGGPERVNGDRGTGPLKRLEQADPYYMRTATGPMLVAAAGLEAVLQRCPTFAAWWRGLLA